jgi:deoxyadenosine/deoxycytidine kinase
MDRSFHSAVPFIWVLHEFDDLTYKEYRTLMDWRIIMKRQFQPVHYALYMESAPILAYERIMMRGRNEEAEMDIEYLVSLHDAHERWIKETTDFERVIRIPGNLSPTQQRDQVQGAVHKLYEQHYSPHA